VDVISNPEKATQRSQREMLLHFAQAVKIKVLKNCGFKNE
jgi:hypothetical protein